MLLFSCVILSHLSLGSTFSVNMDGPSHPTVVCFSLKGRGYKWSFLLSSTNWKESQISLPIHAYAETAMT
jgi:hypothetical protein